MKFLINNIPPAKYILRSIFTFSAIAYGWISMAQNCDFEISTTTSAVTNQVFQPGDTLCLMAGIRGPLYLKDIVGSQENPIVILNKGGQSIIDSDLNYGIRFANCQNIVLSGAGDSQAEYGIFIRQVSGGSGLDIGGKSSDFEVSQIEISNVKYSGIVAKTDPNCTYTAVRDSFALYNLNIHHNYIHHTGNEGMYIGSSLFLGQYLSDCDTTVFPHLIEGVEIHHNRVEYTGWDAIQVGSALSSCAVYSNDIFKDSQAAATYQMSGIMINPGSSCNVYNNRIIDGKGTGISLQSTGGQLIYNNLIVNAGRDYYPNDQTTTQKFGIFCKYSYIQPPDSSFHFYNNTIINPKSDGIRFMNDHSKNNRFINNIIINPGAYDYYENMGSVNYEARDAYIHNYLDAADIFSVNNILERSSKAQYFADTLSLDYHLTAQSPAINSGYNLSSEGILFDIDFDTRPFNTYYDIGAYEYQLITNTSDTEIAKQSFTVSPNPARSLVLLRIVLSEDKHLNLKLIDMAGKERLIFSNCLFHQGKNRYELSVSDLHESTYLLVLYNSKTQLVQSFQKI